MKALLTVLSLLAFAQVSLAANYICLATAVPEITKAQVQAGHLPPTPQAYPLILNGRVGTMGNFTVKVVDASFTYPVVIATVQSLRTGQTVSTTSAVLPGTNGSDLALNLVLSLSEPMQPALASPAMFLVHCYQPTNLR